MHAAPALARETRPYFDLAGGLGLGGVGIGLADGTQSKPSSTVYLLDGRFMLPFNQGVGLRISHFEELQIFEGTATSETTLAALGYVLRAGPQPGFHPVPAIFLGPSLSHYAAPNRDALCRFACELEPLEPTDHAALGLAAAFSLDLHGEALFGGLDIAGNYGFPLADRQVQVRDWALSVSLRFGVTIKARDLKKAPAKPEPPAAPRDPRNR